VLWAKRSWHSVVFASALGKLSLFVAWHGDYRWSLQWNADAIWHPNHHWHPKRLHQFLRPQVCGATRSILGDGHGPNADGESDQEQPWTPFHGHLANATKRSRASGVVGLLNNLCMDVLIVCDVLRKRGKKARGINSWNAKGGCSGAKLLWVGETPILCMHHMSEIQHRARATARPGWELID